MDGHIGFVSVMLIGNDDLDQSRNAIYGGEVR